MQFLAPAFIFGVWSIRIASGKLVFVPAWPLSPGWLHPAAAGQPLALSLSCQPVRAILQFSHPQARTRSCCQSTGVTLPTRSRVPISQHDGVCLHLHSRHDRQGGAAGRPQALLRPTRHRHRPGDGADHPEELLDRVQLGGVPPEGGRPPQRLPGARRLLDVQGETRRTVSLLLQRRAAGAIRRGPTGDGTRRLEGEGRRAR